MLLWTSALRKLFLLRGFIRLYQALAHRDRHLFSVLRHDACEERVVAIELKNAKEGTGWGFDEYYVLTAGGAAGGRCD